MKSIGTNLLCFKKVYSIEIEGGMKNEYWLYQSKYRRTKHHETKRIHFIEE